MSNAFKSSAEAGRLPGLEAAGADEGVGEEGVWCERVTGYAASLRAFDAVDFAGDGGNDDQTAALAAGSLVVASKIFIDEVMEDIATLARDGGVVADDDSHFLALAELPPGFADRYDGRFARKFLVATVMVTGRMAAPHWKPPACLAEALALHIVVRRAQELLSDHGCLDGRQAHDLYAAFEDAAFEDLDHEWLYDAKLSGLNAGADGTEQPRAADDRQLLWFEATSETDIHSFLAEC
ncbi:hypothetical protein HH310_19945 [Actinoplanes sp. TBRC 11911]|uniref:hypothetical protein n=1 Tax=Actinoplanes sp. TBRC 11911 TaxID=2729386 RepID=UPI00145CBDD1|nr:hypothetical protein [Actinoplanes sp. TBRC 11911]NMO53448.1 hypothetical protein [Actinoplanes sp. TBRC 11911]